MKVCDTIKRELMPWCRKGAADVILSSYFFHWYEADLLRITKAGYVTEYEVKVSRADYKADFKKGDGHKHTLLQERKITGVHRFYFVVPKDLIPVKDVPPYAGLIYYCPDRFSLKADDWRLYNGTPFRDVKAAPLLHKTPLPADFWQTIAVKLAWREAILREKLDSMRRQRKHETG